MLKSYDMERRGFKELERLYQLGYEEWFFFGYFDRMIFVDWLMKQEMDLLEYTHKRFSRVPNKKSSEIGCEHVEYAMTHRKLVSLPIFPN